MKLSLEQIKDITVGAESVKKIDGKIAFFRFNDEELLAYSTTAHVTKTYSTAGIQLEFITDAVAIRLAGSLAHGSSRLYYCIEVFADGNLAGDIRNFEYEDMKLPYTGKKLPLDDFDKTIPLGEGEKNVRVVLPWSVAPLFDTIELVGANFVRANKREKNMLVYGDSITHGYDTLSPSKAYSVAVPFELSANAINKAIGGEIFFPTLSKIRSSITPDYITVAYGTNDWAKCTYEEFKANAEEFFTGLSHLYPTAKIFAITPIWRKEINTVTTKFTFEDIKNTFDKIAQKLENLTVISGFEFVPQDENLYADLRLHPSDEGFEYYKSALLREIKKYI